MMRNVAVTVEHDDGPAGLLGQVRRSTASLMRPTPAGHAHHAADGSSPW